MTPSRRDWRKIVLLEKSSQIIHWRVVGKDKNGRVGHSKVRSFFITLNPPVNNKLVSATDVDIPGRGLSTTITRTYLLDSTYIGPLGYKWTHSFNMHLRVNLDGLVKVFNQDGTESFFRPNEEGGYKALPGDFRVLTKNSDGTFLLREKNGLTYSFDSKGKLNFIQDTNGNKISLSYDTFGLLKFITDVSGRVTELIYNPENRIKSIIYSTGRVIGYDYDTKGNLTSVTDAAGHRTLYTYDRAKQLLKITDALGKSIYFSYSRGILTSEENEDGINKLTFRYNSSPSSTTMTVTDALGDQTKFTLGHNGNYDSLTGIEDPLGNQTTFTFDADLNVTNFTNANGHPTTFTYDNNGNLLSETDAKGNTTTFTYESTFNKVTSITDAKGNLTTFDYDGNGNLLKTTYPDGSYESFRYDAFGNMTEKTSRRGLTLYRTYNDNGQLTTETYSDNTVSFTYDDAGNLKSLTDQHGTIAHSYDVLNRITRVSYPSSHTINYVYDAAGNLSSMGGVMGAPGPAVIHNTYDSANRLVSISDSSGQVVQYSYDKAIRRILKELGNATYTTYTYDAAENLLELVNKKSSGEIISSFSYTYDNVGNRLTMKDKDGIHLYEYDPNRQLTRHGYPGGSTYDYFFDSVGNRTDVINGGVTSYTTNNLNQYTVVGDTTYTYDNDGNLISKTTPSGTTTYEFDVGGVLNQVTTPAGITKYGYYLFGRRTSKTDSSGTIKYIYNGHQIVMELDNEDQLSASYIYGVGIDEVLRMTRNGKDYYYHYDGLGSVVDLTDSSQNIVESYKYSAYGKPNITSLVGNPFMFTGREYDAETGLYYYRARYYDPDIGRFISEDPIGFLGGLNMYAYVGNNPIILIDPLGLFRWDTFGVGVVEVIAGVGGIYAGSVLAGATAGLGSLVAAHAIQQGFVAAGIGIADIAGAFFDSPPFVTSLKSLLIGAHFFSDLPPALAPKGGVCPTFIQPPRSELLKLLNKPESLEKEHLVAQICIPSESCLVRADIPIFGLAYGKGFKEYRVEYGEGRNPEEWVTIETSNLPQTEAKIPMDIGMMQGDIDLRGNLATWNTGLKNWEHLPWHPADDPIDLNGVYTLRLVVMGENREVAEDRVTVEVGRVIARVLPGIAISADKKVVLRFPEQSVMEPFRVFTIKSVEEGFPSVPDRYKLVSKVYEFREPGEKFTKDVNLEIEYSSDDLGNIKQERLGIYTYDWEKQKWSYLKSLRKAEENKLLTEIQGITNKHAYYCILASPFSQENSYVYQEEPSLNLQEILDKQAKEENILICMETFENDIGEWSNRDAEAGASVVRDDAATLDGSYCLKLTNMNFGGNFAANVRQTPFDAREYPVVEFDYKISSDVKINFLVRVNDRWYDILFTDDSKEYKYKDLNMSGIGRIENIIADGKWHHARFNLYEMLKTKTGNHIVQEMIMADWDVTGFMKLEFGKNPQGATYYIDNFVIRRETATLIAKAISNLLVNNFDSEGLSNCIAGASGFFVDPDRKASGQMSVEKVIRKAGSAEESNVLKLSWDVTSPESYGGYWCSLNGVDLSEFESMTLWAKCLKLKAFIIGLKDNYGNESKVYIKHYLSDTEHTQEWQKVTVPLTAFSGISNWENLETMSICFENQIGSSKGIIFIDDIQFEKKIGWKVVETFDNMNDKNLLGGSRGTLEHGAAAIGVGYSNKQVYNSLRGFRISYGGNIGTDLGGGDFSYSNWVTQLMGIDATEFEGISFHIRGEKGDESPNIYLSDGTKRACVDIEKYIKVSTDWQQVNIPLKDFSSQDVDITHMEEFQIVFEWENMSGTIYIDDLKFEALKEPLILTSLKN